MSLEEKDTEIQKLKRETSYLQEAANGGRPGSGRSSSPHSQAGRSKLSVGADSVVAHASVSEERAQAIKEMKRHESVPMRRRVHCLTSLCNWHVRRRVGMMREACGE